jgi:hypothetical protein
MSNEVPSNLYPANYSPYPIQTPPAYRLDLGRLFEDVYTLYKQHFGEMILIGLFVFGTSFSVGLVLGIVETVIRILAEQQNNRVLWGIYFAAQFFHQAIMILLNAWLLPVVFTMILSLARGSELRYSLIFIPFQKILKSIGIMFMTILITHSLPILFCGVIVSVWCFLGCPDIHKQINIWDNTTITLLAVSALLSVIGICWMLYAGTRLQLAFLFLADRNDGVFDSIGNSWRITRGNVLFLFAGMLVLSICSMLGLLLCCVGIILTYAFALTGCVLAYLQITGQPSICDSQRHSQSHPVLTL